MASERGRLGSLALASGRFGNPRAQHAALASALTIDAKSGLDRAMEGDPSSRRRFRRAVMASVVARWKIPAKYKRCDENCFQIFCMLQEAWSVSCNSEAERPRNRPAEEPCGTEATFRIPAARSVTSKQRPGGESRGARRERGRMRCTPQAPARRAQPDAGQRRNAVTGMSRAPSVARHVFTVYTEPSGTSNLVQCGRGYDGVATRARHGGFRPVHPYGHACAHLRQPRLRHHGRSPVAHIAPCRGTRHRYRFMWWPVQPALSLLASRRLRKRSLPLRPTISPRTCARAHYMRWAGPRAPPLGHLLSPFLFCLRAPLIFCTCSGGASPLPSPDSRPWDTPYPPILYFIVPLLASRQSRRRHQQCGTPAGR